VTSGTLVLAALDAIGPVIRSSMLEVLPAEDGADGLCRPRVAGAGEMAASDRSGDGEWRQRWNGHELSNPIDGMGHSRGRQPGSKVSTMIIRPPQQGQEFRSPSACPPSARSRSLLDHASG
jgi:hypothetical protein